MLYSVYRVKCRYRRSFVIHCTSAVQLSVLFGAFKRLVTPAVTRGHNIKMTEYSELYIVTALRNVIGNGIIPIADKGSEAELFGGIRYKFKRRKAVLAERFSV